MKKNVLKWIGVGCVFGLLNQNFGQPTMMDEDRGAEASVSVSQLSQVGSSYRNNIRSTVNGEVAIKPVLPKAAEMVTINLTPDEGYEVNDVIVTNSSGLPVVLVKLDELTYQYQQPDSTVTILGTFSSIEPPVSIEDFTDLNPEDWYYNYIKLMIDRGVMLGTSDTLFQPYSTVTRAQMAVIISSIQNKGELSYIPQQLTDIKEDSWYYDAAHWCVYHGILIADTWTEFEAERDITREELLEALMCFGKHVGFYTHVYDRSNLENYGDWEDISENCLDAVSWGLRNFFINGDDEGNLNPQAVASRAEVSVILSEFFKGYDYYIRYNYLKR